MKRIPKCQFLDKRKVLHIGLRHSKRRGAARILSVHFAGPTLIFAIKPPSS